jgi:pimeloyl-ACP methyl ester carboxylesterase
MVESFLAYGDPALWTPDPIDVPLLCLLAAAAPFWTDEYEAWVRGLAPGVDYRKLEGVGHFVQLDAPDEVNAAIEEFLDANRLL